ncbi:hypothetical protein WE697_004287 [Escherichia coli O111:H5]|nr:hypothetical protein [Salmonella enterica]
MKQKFRATAISSNQLSFFSILDIDEDEITQIVDSPKEHLNDAYTSGLNFKSEESNISEINYDSERRENHLYEKSKLLKNQILHTINFAAETDYLYTVEEYNPDLCGLVIEWTPEDVYVVFLSAMEESLEIIKELVLRRKLFFKDDNGNITVNPLLEAETRWYMSKSFEYTCLSHGLDACEFRAELKSWLYYHSHRSISENTKLAECRNDDEIILHDCNDDMGWDIFFDQDYLMSEKKLAVKWTDREIMDVYIKAFKSTLELFDELVSCDLLTKRNAFGKLEINPIFENHFEWIMSEAFEIVGNHLGYNVPQIRKLMATICQMNLK